MGKDELLARIRDGHELTRRDRLSLLFSLAMPAMLSQLCTIVESFSDQAMVGSMGPEAQASIGLVETSIWLLGSLSAAASTGFYVQVAHHIGANDIRGARDVFRQSITSCLLFCSMLVAIGLCLSPWLPAWLGGDPVTWRDATIYFAVFCLSMPLHQLCSLSSGVLRCAGYVLQPALLQVLSCILNVAFNYLLIFQCGLGVLGAALGTCCAELVVSAILTWYASINCPMLDLRQDGEGWRGFQPRRGIVRRACVIAGPIGIQRIIMNVAQIICTWLVAPLGVVAVAANTISITIEQICYMPGYGISDAATTLVGQSIGARRKGLCRQFARLTVLSGIAVMSIMAVIMFASAELLASLMAVDAEQIALSARILRIEAFAEPMFAASIVCYGVFVGAGDTFLPSVINLASMWGVRVVLAFILVKYTSLGLVGVWIAMAVELCIRGLLFLWRLRSPKWLNKVTV